MSATISPRKRRANRANARKSTGPQTEEGKSRSSRNATTHGLFCKDLVLPGEDQTTFHFIREGFLRRFNPQDLFELMLVDRIVAANWKLRRLQESEWLLHQSEADRIKDQAIRRIEEGESQIDPDTLIDVEEAIEEQTLPPASYFASARFSQNDQLEKFSRLEQRLEYSMHRAINQFQRLRKNGKERDEESLLPLSPYLGDWEAARECGKSEIRNQKSETEDSTTTNSQRSTNNPQPVNMKNEPTAPQAEVQVDVQPAVMSGEEIKSGAQTATCNSTSSGIAFPPNKGQFPDLIPPGSLTPEMQRRIAMQSRMRQRRVQSVVPPKMHS